METTKKLEKFHDYTLEEVITDWSNGTIILVLNFEIEYRIKISNFIRCSIPRLLPWGNSLYVYEIEEEKTRLNTSLLRIRMQSGDVLEFEGSETNVVQIGG